MRKFLWAILCVQALAITAYATSDITCVNGDCLHNGWNMTGANGTFMVTCNSGDCTANGWVSNIRGYSNEQVRCKNGGCFNEGWFSYNPANGQMVAEVTCVTSFSSTDCLTNGWTVTTTGSTTPSTISCTQGDCRTFGWDVAYPAKPLARCKQGGCFVAGWTSYN